MVLQSCAITTYCQEVRSRLTLGWQWAWLCQTIPCQWDTSCGVSYGPAITGKSQCRGKLTCQESKLNIQDPGWWGARLWPRLGYNTSAKLKSKDGVKRFFVQSCQRDTTSFFEHFPVRLLKKQGWHHLDFTRVKGKPDGTGLSSATFHLLLLWILSGWSSGNNIWTVSRSHKGNEECRM